MMRLLMPLIILLLVTACGKTGDLYLPEPDQPAESPVKNEEANRGSL